MLTTEQRAVLAADIAADGAFTALPHNTDGAYEIAAAYNAPANPAFYVWKTNAATADIYDAITWASLTPADMPDGTALYTNRALQCQAKQINLQIMLQGQQQINAAKLKVRQGLTDALQNVPAGAGGALLDAGWTTVKQALYRPATRLEKLFAVGTGTTGVPATMAIEGAISYQEVNEARG